MSEFSVTTTAADDLAETLTLWVGRVVRERPLDPAALSRRALERVAPYPEPPKAA